VLAGELMHTVRSTAEGAWLATSGVLEWVLSQRPSLGSALKQSPPPRRQRRLPPPAAPASATISTHSQVSLLTGMREGMGGAREGREGEGERGKRQAGDRGLLCFNRVRRRSGG